MKWSYRLKRWVAPGLRVLAGWRPLRPDAGKRLQGQSPSGPSSPTARTPMRELIDLAGGMRAGHELKFWTPGGSSTPLFTAEHLDVPLDYESVAAAGSMLGTRALQIFDETTCVVRAITRWMEFYAHESCGKCTPCREGTQWTVKMLERIKSGQATPMDLDIMASVQDQIIGHCLCVLGDAMAMPVGSMIAKFRPEFEAYIEAARDQAERDLIASLDAPDEVPLVGSVV